MVMIPTTMTNDVCALEKGVSNRRGVLRRGGLVLIV